jgi:hypothetical protein
MHEEILDRNFPVKTTFHQPVANRGEVDGVSA